MNKYLMRIDEILDNPYEWHWADTRGKFQKMLAMKTAVVTGGDLAGAMFPDAPSKFSAKFQNLAAIFDVEDDVIWVMFKNSGSGTWEISFDAQSNEFSDNQTKRYGLTGKGHSGRILATVAAIIQEFIKRYKPKAMEFTAHDKKRASIYKAMLKKFKNFEGYKTSHAPADDFDTFSIHKY